MIKGIPLQFKRSTLVDQFNKVDPRIRAITSMIAHYTVEHWEYVITITCIYRSQEVQNSYYAAGLTKAKKSPHTFWRAIDIRMRDLNKKRRQEICDLVNKNFPRKGRYKTALVHGRGSNVHLHCQVST